MRDSLRFAFAALGSAALFAAGLGRGLAPAAGAIVPLPLATASGQTPPPLTATATPTPSGKLLAWTGQILDDRSGFVFFTTGDGFRLAPNVKIASAKTGGATTLQPVTRTYARATFDTGNGAVTELALSNSKLPAEANYADVKGFAVALSTPAPNPDLENRHAGFSGRPVLVTFTVEVPSRTPFGDEVFIATDQSGWSATAIRMDRIDAIHYRISGEYASGTRLLYRYTRGSWNASERDQHGQQTTHELVLHDADVRTIRDVVYAWGDQDQTAPDLGNALPTPFNPGPFVLPPRGH